MDPGGSPSGSSSSLTRIYELLAEPLHSPQLRHLLAQSQPSTPFISPAFSASSPLAQEEDFSWAQSPVSLSSETAASSSSAPLGASSLPPPSPSIAEPSRPNPSQSTPILDLSVTPRHEIIFNPWGSLPTFFHKVYPERVPTPAPIPVDLTRPSSSYNLIAEPSTTSSGLSSYRREQDDANLLHGLGLEVSLDWLVSKRKCYLEQSLKDLSLQSGQIKKVLEVRSRHLSRKSHKAYRQRQKAKVKRMEQFAMSMGYGQESASSQGSKNN